MAPDADTAPLLLSRAPKILRRLQEDGRLMQDKVEWIGMIEKQLGS